MLSQKRHELIPDEAFLFMPPADAIVSGKHRFIFGGEIPFNELEQSKLKQFDNWLQTTRAHIEAYWTADLRLRFLQSNNYDFEKTKKSMVQHIKWKSTAILKEPPYQITKYLEKGLVYHCGRDHYFRPIFVISVKKVTDSGFSAQQASSLFGFYFNFVIQNLMIPGQVQNWITIIDLDKVSLMSAGSAMKNVITFLSNTFKGYLKSSYIVKCPSTIYIFWSGVKNLLEQQTVKKIQMFDSNVPKPMFIHTHPSQVQQKYGGTKPNMTQFWPMVLPPGPYEYGNTRNYMVSKQEYKKMHLANKLKSRKVNEKYLFQEALESKVLSQGHPPQLPTFKTMQTEKVRSDSVIVNPLGSNIPNIAQQLPLKPHHNMLPGIVPPTEMIPLPQRPVNQVPQSPQNSQSPRIPQNPQFTLDPRMHQINNSQIKNQLSPIRDSSFRQQQSMASLVPQMKNGGGSQHQGYQPPLNQVPVSGSLLVLQPNGQNNMHMRQSFGQPQSNIVSPQQVRTSHPQQRMPQHMAAQPAPPFIPAQVIPPKPVIINAPITQPFVPQVIPPDQQQALIRVTPTDDPRRTSRAVEQTKRNDTKSVHFEHPKAVRLPYKPYVVPAAFSFDMDADEGILEQIMLSSPLVKPTTFQ